MAHLIFQCNTLKTAMKEPMKLIKFNIMFELHNIFIRRYINNGVIISNKIIKEADKIHRKESMNWLEMKIIVYWCYDSQWKGREREKKVKFTIIGYAKAIIYCKQQSDVCACRKVKCFEGKKS